MGDSGEILFFHEGTFSHQNPFVQRCLKQTFPVNRVRSIDMWRDILRPSPAYAVAALFEAVLGHPRSTLGKIQNPKIYATRTRFARRRFLRWSARELSSGKTKPVFTFQTQSIFNASIPGIPHFVYTDHTFLANERYAMKSFRPEAPKSWLQRETEIYTSATRCFVTSNFCRNSLIEDYGLAPRDVVTVFCGANAEPPPGLLPTGRSAESDVIKILFVGIEWERKGGPELVQAFHSVHLVYPNTELLIAGVGGVADNVPGCRVLGRIPLVEVKELFKKADIFCLPSRREPSAVVLSEALAYGLPIVATNVGGTPDRVINEETGLLVPPGDTAALAAALGRLCSDSSLRKRMGEAGKRLGETHFTWDAVAGKLGAAIRESLPEV